jgi:toxin ParE1/3/4
VTITVNFSDQARRDFDRLYDFGFRRWGERRTEIFIRELHEKCLGIGDNPDIGRQRDDVGLSVRVMVFRDIVVFYRWNSGGDITVVRVFHGKEDTRGLEL